MGFFRGSAGSDPGESDPGGGEDALARIEAGGIPLSAERRLQALGKDGALLCST